MSFPTTPVGRIRMPWQLPVSLALAALVLVLAGPTPAAVPGVALAAVAPELALVDAREHRLPNRMTFPALAVAAAGVLASVVADGDSTAAIAGAAYGGGMLLLAVLGGVGMGDAKLAALIGLACPTSLLALGAPVLGLLAGGIGGAVALIRGGRARRIPFGPFLLAGWVLALAAQLALVGPRGG
ncbi:MAG: prepilin peptidase [Micrococcales bacterium]|nr:prepilin peptidase [Micrococcales bacterium]